MSKERFCPECGAKLAENEHFCPDCGADIETTALPPEPVKPAIERSAPAKGQESGFIGTGARINANGGISNTSNSVSTTTMTKNTSVNTQSVDNSSTVNNNTTIVMGGKDKSEYCEVCGNPFGDKHARCPKCGKQICFDCKVKSKNRCIECEKKAINEYRVAFQQLLLTTNGNIGIAGRQMMDSKARELDVEDVKAGIEKELTDLLQACCQTDVARRQPRGTSKHACIPSGSGP
ncbi:MAG TPA: zinc-ribbon domain-containing protein [Candidatus Coprenecus merdipullorum]|nr:zinc-ribbon domain-containing protein [Candidatus Coprenecus merdipullorum]